MTTDYATQAHADAASASVAAPAATGAIEPRSGWLPGTSSIGFGGDYNPEQWPREIWDEDIRLMKEAGVTLVSIGIFSWALLEPREGEFDFGWLDDVIELLHGAGIGIDLGTPTASPPAWFWKKYPAARPVNRDGVTLGFGSRGMASPSSPEYAEATSRIVRALAERYGKHPGLRLWHVHNEYGAPTAECYSEYSVRAFRAWLLARYGNLDEFNDAWGTTFWGQRYSEWEEVDAPRRAASVVNPTQRLDFARFSSHALLECFRRERDILHELSPGIPVTTNFMVTNCLAVDCWKWADEVDIVSNDHYLVAEQEDNQVGLAMSADLSRSIGGGAPWILMEHSTSAVSWQPRNVAKRPGELIRNSMQHFARGADSVMFFQWRASRFGAEKFHSAMLPQAGTGSAVFRSTVELGSRLGALAPALGSRVSARVAILWDWESFWAQDLEWRPSADLDHRRQIEAFYTRLWHDGVTCDFAHPGADLSGYDLVLAPSLYLLSAESASNIESYVREGGVFVASYFSGIVDANDTVPQGPYPGMLRDVLGIEIQEFAPLLAGQSVSLSNGLESRIWTDDIALVSARSVVDYLTGPAAGGAAITRNSYGAGSAWYLSTEFDADQLATVLAVALAEAGVQASTLPEGLERVERHGEDETFTVYINHSDEDVHLDAPGTVLGDDTDWSAGTLSAGGTAVFRN